MPNRDNSSAEFLTPFTAFPCVLIDRVMPTLKDTEWRLLCVIVRQTVGWKSNGQRHKRRDWLTQRQLMARTGRNSAAISQAVNALVRRRLVEATDEDGNLLPSPQERRRYSGRLYFGLCYTGLDALTPISPPNTKSEEQIEKSALRKAHTTTQEDDNKLPDGILPSDKITAASSQSQSCYSESLQMESRRLLRTYQILFKERTVSGEAPPILWGRDMKIAHDLLGSYPYERLETLLQQFFSVEDAWFRKCGYSWPCFKAAIPKLLLREGHLKEGRLHTAPTSSSDTQARIHTGWQRAGKIGHASDGSNHR